MSQGQIHFAAGLKVKNPTELSPNHNGQQFPLSIYRNPVPTGILPHGDISWPTQVGVLWLPILSWEMGVMVCLLRPGVCVILAVCQSGLGNGHQVITPALTASSISLYRSCTPPNTHYLFFILLCKGAGKRKKGLSGRTLQNTTDSPENRRGNPAPLQSECKYKTDSFNVKPRGLIK